MDRFAVEAGKKVVGVAFRVRGGFRFVASDPDFRSVDSKVFRRARGLTSSIADHARALRARGAQSSVH